jgi:hypothetical protein
MPVEDLWKQEYVQMTTPIFCRWKLFSPCWLLLLRQMGTQEVHLYEKGPLFVGPLGLLPVQEVSVRPWLFFLAQYKMFFFSSNTFSIHLSLSL